MLQHGPEWEAWRRGGVGGSDAPAIVGLSPWRMIHDVYLDKIGEAPPFFITPAMRRGLDLEPEARRAYEKHTGEQVEPCTLEYPEWPIMRASLDGLAWDRNRCCEIKCPNRADHILAVKRRIVPAHYQIQIQHILAVSGVPVCDYVSYHPEEPLAVIQVFPDAQAIDELIEKEREFWGYVVRRELPPGFVPPEDERTDTDWVETARLYREAEAGYAEWDGKRKAARERLIALAGTTTRQQGGGLSLTKLRKTTTDYALACKEAGVNLEPYKGSRDEYRVTIAKGGK